MLGEKLGKLPEISAGPASCRLGRSRSWRCRSRGGVRSWAWGSGPRHVLAGLPLPGVLYGEGQVVMITDDGEMAPWIGGGVGRPTGPGFAASYGVTGWFQTASTKLARLNGVVTAIEYDIEEDGSYAGRPGSGQEQPSVAVARLGRRAPPRELSGDQPASA